MKNFLRRIHTGKILKNTSLTIAVVLTLLLAFLVLLPNLANSIFIQDRIKSVLAASMKRHVSWSKLVVSWSDGLSISSFKLGSGPAPLLTAEIGQVIIVPSVGRGDDGSPYINLALRIHDVRAECAPGPPEKPPLKTKDPLTLLAESVQKLQNLDLPLPLDVRVAVEAAPLNIVYSASGKKLHLKDFSFRFDMPSLMSKPLTAQVAGRILVANSETGMVRLNAKVSDLVTKARRIQLATALFDVYASGPGTAFTMSGGLSRADGFDARLKLDLPRLLVSAQPLLSPDVPLVDGLLELRLQAKVNTKQNLHAALTLDGSGLAANGGLLKKKRFGPLDVKLQQQIVTDHGRHKVDFPDGSVTVPGLADVAWSASVIDPDKPERVANLAIGPLKVDLASVLSHAAPFMPSGFPVRDLVGDFSLRSLLLRMAGPANEGEFTIAGFNANLPRILVALKSGELTGEDVVMNIDNMVCPLIAKLPTRLTTDLLWSVRRLGLSGTNPVSLHGLSGTLGLAVEELNLKSASPLKIAASASVRQTVDLQRLIMANQMTVDNFHEQLLFKVRATEKGDLEVDVTDFAVAAASVSGSHSGKRYGPLAVSAAVSAEGLHIFPEKGVRPTLRKAAASFSAGDFFKLNADVGLSSSVTSSGTARVNLGGAMLTAAPFLPPGLKADGAVSALWKLDLPMQYDKASAGKNVLSRARTGLALFDGLEVALKMDNVSATVPSASGAVALSGLRTDPDIRLISTEKGDSVRLSGAMLFSALSGLPGNIGKLTPQHGSFKFNALLSGWKELRVDEELRIEPLSLFQEAELNVSRIDGLMDENQPFSPAVILKRLNASVLASADGSFSRQLAGLIPGMDMSGSVAGAVRVDLSAGRDIALRFSMKASDFGVQLANGTRVEGLHAKSEINRVYALASAQGERWVPLSTALVRPTRSTAATSGAADIIGRVKADLRGDINGSRSFSIRRVSLKTAGAPLELTALEGDLLFSREQAGISYFQGNLLGGTLLARGTFDLRPEVPVIDTSCSFSNLDISLLLPEGTKGRKKDQDAEITGELSLIAPLTAEQRELFEQVRLAINVRKIGTETLERALFSLDPYERNEQVIAQRKMLRMGSLKGLRANAVDGAFSMEGEALIKGVSVELPKVERMRISELPLRQELTKNRKVIAGLRSFLDLMRADTLAIGSKGELKLKRRDYAQ